MPGKISIYNLGERGVNVVKSPIHLTDGELRSAQNAIFDPASAEGGIRKRGGMPRFSGSAMAGSVMGIVNVPLAAPSQITRYFFLALSTEDADTWARSTDGTTWTEVTSPARAQSITHVVDAQHQYYVGKMATLNRKIYYFGNDYVQGTTDPPVRVYDGTNDYELFRVPFNPAAGSATHTILGNTFCVHDGKLYMSVYDPGGAAPDTGGRVFEFDPDTGYITQVGNLWGNGAGEVAGGMPYSLCSHNGMLWAGTYGLAGASTGRIYSIRPGIDTTWTLRVTTAAGAGWIISMASYKGELYYGTQGDAGSAALLRKRANDGTLSTIDTAPSTDAFNYFGGLTVFNSELYAAWVNLSPAVAKETLIRKWDGSAMSTDRDVATNDGARDVGQPLVYGSTLYFPFKATSTAAADGFLLKKTGGTWSKPLSNANIRGFMGRVDVAPS